MIVYIEYVIIDNVIIDYLLLKCTFSITNTLFNKKRLVLGALFGALIALLYPLTERLFFINLLVKIMGGLVIMLIANVYQNRRAFYVNFAVFFMLTFLTGGAITGIFNLLGVSLNSEFSIGLMFLPVILVISAVTSAIKSIYKNKEVRAYVYKVQLIKDKKSITVNGFLDTGNALFDEKSPVIVCGKKLFLSLVGENLFDSKLKKITVCTINGSTQNYSIKLDKVLIYVGKSVNINSNVTLAVGEKHVGDGYDVILHPALLKGENIDESTVKTQKVS